MKKLACLIVLVTVCFGSVVAWAQTPKLQRMTFRVDNDPVTCVGITKASVTLVFNTAMRDSVPRINFGKLPPYSLKLPLYDLKWVDNTTFTARFDINEDVPSTSDSLYKFLVAGGFSAAGQPMAATLSDTVLNINDQKANLLISRRAKMSANVAKIDYGTIKAGASLDKSVTLKNIGCSDIAITALLVSDPFYVVNSSGNVTLPRDGQLTVSLRFNPRTRRTYNQSFKVRFTGDGRADSLTVPLSGVARGPQIALIPSSLPNFGTVDVGDAVSQTVRITNRAAAEASLSDTLKITNIVTSLNTIYTVSPILLTIAPGDTKSVRITFSPKAGQVYSALGYFPSNDNTQPAAGISLALNGTGREKPAPPKIDSSMVTFTWPFGSKPGYINSNFLTICVALDTAGLKEARWKFTTLANDPPTSASDTTKNGGRGQFTSFQSGRACFQIPLFGKLYTSRWYFYIWLEGRNGVSGYKTAYPTIITYDATPAVFRRLPYVTAGWTGGFANYTNAENLTVCWEVESELSGISEARWKFSRTPVPPQNATDTTSAGGTLRRDGITCATIRLKDKITPNQRWYFYLWLIDGTGNSNHLNAAATQTIINYDLVAPVAPTAPVSRNIPAADWFGANRTLTLNLALPSGARDAARVRWKFKTRPTSTSTADGDVLLSRSESNNASFSVLFNSKVWCGDDSLYFWFADSAGNAIPTNNSFAGYKFDMCEPVIARSRSGEALANKGQAYIDTVLITDLTPVFKDSVHMVYRFGGAQVNVPTRPQLFREIGRQKVGKNIVHRFEINVPTDGVTTRGFEYKVSAKDSLSNLGYGPGAAEGPQCAIENDGYWVAVRTKSSSEFRADKDGNAVALPSGRNQSSYTIFSIPFQLDNGALKAVLEDDLGPYDKKKWRLFEYRPDLTGDNAWVEYTSASISPFKPGNAFFMLVSDPDKVITSGSAKTISTRSKYRIELKKGWNLFSNPFNFPIHRGNLMLTNTSIPLDSINVSILSYEREWTYIDTIEPWRGYAIYVEPRVSTRKIELVICPVATEPRAGKTATPLALAPEEWTIQITAQAGAARDMINWVGARKAAAEEYDGFDQFEPPVIGEYVSVYIPNDHWSQHPMKYTADFRPSGNEVYEWPLMVTTNHAGGEVTLEFKQVADLPDGYDAFLIDTRYGIARNLRRDPTYRIQAGDGGIEKSLKLVVGKPDALQKQNIGVALVPQAFELSQNFPNPFHAGIGAQARAMTEIRYALPKAATVTLEVYNLLGQRVRALVVQQAQTADYYLATWDGRNELGKEVASGVYVYRLLAETKEDRFIATRKLMFVK